MKRTDWSRVLSWLLVLVGAGVVTEPARANPAVYLREARQWRFLPGTREASPADPAAWRASDFDDGDWSVGDAPFGYGRNPPYGTDLSELDPPMHCS